MSYLKNEQIHLRALEPDDLNDIYKWENDTEIWEISNTVAPFSRQIIADYLREYKADIYSQKQLRLMIVENSDKKNVGLIDLYNFDPLNSRVHLGILIDSNCRNRGFGGQATKLIIDYCKNYLQLHQIIIETPANNRHSLKLFENAGFKQCGIITDWLKINGKFVDLLVYQLLF